MSRAPAASPRAVVALGALACLVPGLVDVLWPAGPHDLLEIWCTIAACGSVVAALTIRWRAAGPRALRYEPLLASAGLIFAGMLLVDLPPSFGRTIANVGANVLFTLATALASTIILPALYRGMNRQTIALALLDAGIMMCAGTAIALNLWHGTGGDTFSRLFVPLVASGVGASAGVAVLAVLEWRAAPRASGVWAAIASLPILGLTWANLVESMARNEPRSAPLAFAYAVGVLLIGYGWVTWTDDVDTSERYDRTARLLGDWLPIASLVLCVVMNVVPHNRVDGVDVVALGSVGAVLFSIGRQWLLLGREREALRRLVGEGRLRMEKEAAEKANRANRAFLAMMSHEIRTPMNSILGNSHLLADANLAPLERESVQAIEAAGQELLSLISDILDFSKIEAERMELERVGFAPTKLINSVLSMFATQARERGLSLTADIDPSIPVILAGDPHRLHQILVNLVNNAMKFTSRGGILIRARVVDRNPVETRLRFEVADTGIGIDDETAERLFSAFVQGDASTTRRFGGSGLGLAICKSLVGLMGGEIAIQSTPGEGSTFWFTVRLGSATDQEAAAVLETNDHIDRTVETIGARVLVAEDNAANTRLIERLLTRLGIEVVAVKNGLEAVAAVRRDPFDLVLMDCQMPEMDGLDATRAIRKAGLDLPIVALTANALNSDRSACFEAGMNDYLSKPIRSPDLSAALQRWLRGSIRRDESPEGPPATGVVLNLYRDLLEPTQVEELLSLDPDGSAGFLRAMVDSYHETLSESMPKLGAAIGTGTWPAAEEAAHRLKGVAANMGLRLVNETAARIVAQVRMGETNGLHPLFVELVSALEPTDRALTALLAAAPNAESEGIDDAA